VRRRREEDGASSLSFAPSQTARSSVCTAAMKSVRYLAWATTVAFEVGPFLNLQTREHALCCERLSRRRCPGAAAMIESNALQLGIFDSAPLTIQARGV